MKNYLSERKQRVVINNSTSSWRDINAGVPQGSILDPLLFIVFINDILTDINSTIKLFADDTSLYLIVDDPQETAQTLNDYLVKLHAWSTKWLVNFNPQKTETMTISRKLNKPHQPNLIMNNTIIISTVTEHKHLGLQLSDDGNWNKHIDMIRPKKKNMCVYGHPTQPIFQPPTLTFFNGNYSTLIFANDLINFYTEFG